MLYNSFRDTGTIPGDGRGAGGLDSAMFTHLKRNWSSSSGQSASTRPSAILPPPSVAGERASYEGSASYSQYLMNTTNPSLDTLSPKHRLAGLRNVKLSVYKVSVCVCVCECVCMYCFSYNFHTVIVVTYNIIT